MKNWLRIVFLVVFMSLSFNPINAVGGPGPAPHSGDGVPDGSGFPEPPSPGPGK